MKYKGYTGVVEFDEESGTLFGHVIGLRDGITFQGDSVAEVMQAFRDSVDDYLEFCAERGESPERPFSGQFVLRIDPQLHRVMSHAAEERGVSLNSLIEAELTAAFSPGGQAPTASAKVRRGTAARGRRATGGLSLSKEPVPRKARTPRGSKGPVARSQGGKG
jgi:predicted HicB family RNase H-like nuclease